MTNKNTNKKDNTQKQPELLFKADIQDIWGLDRWKNLFAHVDISSLVFFRMFFGIIMLVEVYRYFDHDWIRRYWVFPKHNFTYWPFDFVSPLPEAGMMALFYFLGILAFCITVGLFYRISTILFFLCFTYSFLLEQARYLNHFYLIVLLSFILIFIPAHRSFSLDAYFFKKIRSETLPAWTLWLARFTIAVPYFFGGIAKITPDWLRGQPLKMWLAEDTDFPMIGQFFREDWMVLLMAYSGLLLDLAIVPMLLFKRTRIIGLVLITAFHLMNSELFEIGIFPWFMLGASALFFRPDWFRKLINTLTGKWQRNIPADVLPLKSQIVTTKQKFILTALTIWAAFNILMPLRHFAIPGNVHWTEEGHLYSWHMKLRTKRGDGFIVAIDKKTGEKNYVDARDYLKSWQRRKMWGHPDLIWQFCQIIRRDFAARGKDVSVYANVEATLNGRKVQHIIDPNIDLAAQPRSFISAPWIIPLHTPLDERLED